MELLYRFRAEGCFRMSLIRKSSSKCFGGEQLRFSHQSVSCSCEMTFSVFLPSMASTVRPPVLWWLSGLTCTDQNFMFKSGVQRYAAACGLAVIAPDTSPRGVDVPDDPGESYDFGLGAGFYLNATQSPWDKHYRMYDYITEELPSLVAAHLPVNMDAQGISGHSMGGHGALTIALRMAGRFKSVSAFSPVVSVMNCPWGRRALRGYLGDDEAHWRHYDACALIKSARERFPLLVDQGESDEFLSEQLKPQLLQEACADAGHPLTLRMQPGYDHSYYFIASFMEDHIMHHARALL